MAGSKRERALTEKSLICLLQACEGHTVTVELRNESFAQGIISQVDGYMNVTMTGVEFTQQGSSNSSSKILHLEEMFIQAKQIRFVQIPDEINMREAIERQLKTLKNSRIPMTRKSKKK